MAKIYKSDIKRITDAMERNEDWRALILSFPYDLRDRVERLVVGEHTLREYLREERRRFNRLTQEEKEQSYINDSIKYDEIRDEFEESLKASGRSCVIDKRTEKRREKQEKANAERLKKAREMQAQKEKVERAWKSRRPYVFLCWALAIALSLYVLYLAWHPSWGTLAVPAYSYKKIFSLIFKILFSTIPLAGIVMWCVFIRRRAYLIAYIFELLFFSVALGLTYDLLYHVIHTSWGEFFFLAGALFAWGWHIALMSFLDDKGYRELSTYIGACLVLCLWLPIYAFCVCGEKQCWGPKREAWKVLTTQEQKIGM